jgi:hypothetical protein
MPSSGVSAVVTTTADKTLAMAADRASVCFIRIVNGGANPGLFTFEKGTDGNDEYHYVAGAVGGAAVETIFDLSHNGARRSPAVYMKRIGAADLASVYVSSY